MALLKAWQRLLPLAVLLAAIPAALAFSSGICVGCEGASSAPPGEFEHFGCAACHGEHLKFAAVSNAGIAVTATDPSGAVLNGPYVAHTVYDIAINFTETNVPSGGGNGNHAGFNLRASAGKLIAVPESSQVSGDGKQATHLDAKSTSWRVQWEAPESGAAGFSLFVNDVDASGAQDEADQVHWVQFGFADKDGAVLGAVEEHEVHFGITLQQYWIGLIALVGMIFVMVAGFVYLKFVNPHNTDQKDR